MDSFWLEGLGNGGEYSGRGMGRPTHGEFVERTNAALEQRTAIRDLTHQVERLSLLNQALWELLRERLQVTDADLQAKALEVDLRDGVQDEKMTTQPVACPSCSRVSSSKHYRCLYCGQLFERPLFG